MDVPLSHKLRMHPKTYADKHAYPPVFNWYATILNAVKKEITLY